MVFFLFSCQVTDPTFSYIDEEVAKVTIHDELNTQLDSYYFKDINYKITCLNGSCDDQYNSPSYLVKQECFFCNNSNIINNTIELSIAPAHNSELSTSCSNNDVYAYPSQLKIIEQSADFIKAVGMSKGTFERVGPNCENFKYEYEIEREYIFTTRNLSRGLSIEASLSNDANNITIPKWTNPAPAGSEYSSGYLSVNCNSDVGLNVQPSYVVTKYNGLDATTTPVANNLRGLPSNQAQTSFASFDSGNYTIRGSCYVYEEDTQVLSDEFYLFVR